LSDLAVVSFTIMTQSDASLIIVRRGKQHTYTRRTVSRLIELYDAWGEPAQAAPYRALPQAQGKR